MAADEDRLHEDVRHGTRFYHVGRALLNRRLSPNRRSTLLPSGQMGSLLQCRNTTAGSRSSTRASELRSVVSRGSRREPSMYSRPPNCNHTCISGL
jgi:hypothetical protein